VKEPDSINVRKRIDAGNIPGVWLWIGPEQFLKDELFKQLAAKVVDAAAGSMAVHRFRAGEDAADTILATCRTVPMLSPRQAVLVKDVAKISGKSRESLLAYVADPSPETALVLMGDKGPGESWHRDLATTGAETAVFWTPFENQTRQWIQIRFKDLGKRCDTATAEAFLERCGGGWGEKVALHEVAPEIEKVAVALGDRKEVTEGDLAVIGRKAAEALRQDVVNRATRKDISGALQALDGALLFRGNSEIRLVAMLTHRMMNIAEARDRRTTGEGRPARIWPTEWKEVEPAVNRFDQEGLRRSILALAAADRTLKSRPKNPRAVLEHTIITICR